MPNEKKTSKKKARRREHPQKKQMKDVLSLLNRRKPQAHSAVTESVEDRVKRATNRIVAEGTISSTMLAVAMLKCNSPKYQPAFHALVTTLAKMIVDKALDMKTVTSKNVEAVGYDEIGQTLRVRFQGGRSYDYDDVPEETAADLLLAESKGSFIARRIKPNFTARALD